MPDGGLTAALAAASNFFLYTVPGYVGGAVAGATGSTAAGGLVATGLYTAFSAAPQVLAAAALSAASVPRPEAGQVSFRQSVPYRVGAYGTCRLGGPSAFWEAKGNWAVNVVMLKDGEVDAFHRTWLNDDEVELEMDGDVVPPGNGRYPAGFVNIQVRNGLATETHYSNVEAKFPEWDVDHRLDGIASLAQLAGHGNQEEFQKRYPNGEPAPSRECDTERCYDPADPAQDPADRATWTFTRNTMRQLLHHEMFETRQAWDDVMDGGVIIQEFNAANWARLFEPELASWIQAISDCDQGVATADGGFVRRYESGGFWFKNAEAETVRQQLLTACDGWICPTGSGAIRAFAGRYRDPTVTLQDVDATGRQRDILGYTCRQFVEDDHAVNLFQVTFTDPTTGYSEAEPQPWRNEADILERGRERAMPMPLPWVQSTSQARRLAKRADKKANATGRGYILCDLTDNALDAIGERYLRVQISDSTLLQDATVEVTGLEISLTDMTLRVDYITIDATIDTWNAAAEEGLPPSAVSRPAPEPIPVPENIVVNLAFDAVSAGGNQGVRLLVEFDDPAREDLSFLVRWKVTGSDTYSYETFSEAEDLTGTLQVKTKFVPSDTSLDVSVAFISGSGARGDFADDETVTSSTAGAPPSSPTNLSATTPTPPNFTVSWRNPTTSNFHHSRLYRYPFSGGSFGLAIDITGERAGAPGAEDSFPQNGLGSGTYQYWIVAENSADTQSAPTGPVVVVVP